MKKLLFIILTFSFLLSGCYNSTSSTLLIKPIELVKENPILTHLFDSADALKVTSSEVVKDLEVITEIWEDGKLIDKKISSVNQPEKDTKKRFNADIYFTLKHYSCNKTLGELTYSIKEKNDFTCMTVPFKSKQNLDKYMLSSFVNHNDDSLKNYRPGDEIELWGAFRYTSNMYPLNSLTDMAKKSKWSIICKFKNKI